jgi:hypothetical protein
MDPRRGRGTGRIVALAAALVALVSLAGIGSAIADTSTPDGATGATGATGTTGATTTCAAADTTCTSTPDTPAAKQPRPCPVSAATCPTDQVLSNETTSTTWAYDDATTPVRRAPSTSSSRVATLHQNTEDDLPEVYIALRERQVGSTNWVELRIPMRPNGTTGWAPRAALSDFQAVTTELVLTRADETLKLYRAGHLIFSAPAGIGTPGDPTPTGHFWIREEFPVRGDAAYGPFAFGTSAYAPGLTDWPGGGVVGVHGTNQPGLVPGRPSHGCVRLRNSDIARLSHLVPIGTPLLIQ